MPRDLATIDAELEALYARRARGIRSVAAGDRRIDYGDDIADQIAALQRERSSILGKTPLRRIAMGVDRGLT